MKITVVGKAITTLQPELAELHLSLGFQSGQLERAVRDATEVAEAFNQELRRLNDEDPCPVTETVLLPLSTRSWRPWSQDGSQLPFQHEAASRAKLTFANFRAMSAFINDWGRQPGVTINHVDWKLTDEREAAETSRILGDAVADARARAATLAAAAGEGEVRFVELSDTPFNDVRQDMFSEAGLQMARGAAGGGEGVDLTPEDIIVQVRVHARFTTD